MRENLNQVCLFIQKVDASMGIDQMILDASKAISDSIKTSSEGASMMDSHYAGTVKGEGKATGASAANNSIQEDAEGEEEDSDV